MPAGLSYKQAVDHKALCERYGDPVPPRVQEIIDRGPQLKAVPARKEQPQTAPVVPPPGIPQQSVPQESIPLQNTPERFSPDSGYYPTFNELSDRIIPELKLNVYEQAVLQRLYRLSRGWKKTRCTVGLGTLSKSCVMSRSQVQKAIASLLGRDLIRDLGHSQQGTVYEVLPSLPGVPQYGMPGGKQSVPQQDMGKGSGIPQYGNNKNNKELKTTKKGELASPPINCPACHGTGWATRDGRGVVRCLH